MFGAPGCQRVEKAFFAPLPSSFLNFKKFKKLLD